MKLIDGDALKKKLQARRNNSEEDYTHGYNNGLKEVIDLIDNAPEIDPRIEYGTDGQPYRLFMSGGQVVPDTLQGWRYEERPQGEWVIEHDWVHCSSCGHEQNYPSNFCSKCGAEMRKGGAE